jgi:hypothetical protein
MTRGIKFHPTMMATALNIAESFYKGRDFPDYTSGVN